MIFKVFVVLLCLFSVSLFVYACLVSIVAGISVYQNIRLGNIIIDMEDAVNESLDILDESYKTFATISQKEVFFDSPEIRAVINEINRCKDAVLYIANSFAKIDEDAINYDEKE